MELPSDTTILLGSIVNRMAAKLKKRTSKKRNKKKKQQHKLFDCEKKKSYTHGNHSKKNIYQSLKLLMKYQTTTKCIWSHFFLEF